MNNKGFTLLEVLIAIAVLAISMLGIYKLSFASLTASAYAKDKAYVDELCYQRVLERLAYPSTDFEKVLKDEDGVTVKFSDIETPSIYDGITQIAQQAETDSAKAVYYYYVEK